MTKRHDTMLPAELQPLFEVVPATDAAVSEAQRNAAWERLRSRLHDPTRVPFHEDVKAPLELVRDDEVGAAQVDPQVVRPSRAPAISAGVPRVAPRRPWSARVVASAAAVVLMAGAGVWSTGTRSYSVPRGAAPQQYTLADGSSAWVAPGSTIAVSRRLGWPAPVAPAAREVVLDGEAYFEVRRDGRPFAVRASEVTVQVLGTRFSVRGGASYTTARVDVNEGRVAVSANGVREELGAGQGISWGGGAMQRRAVDPAKVATWRSGGLAALDEPLRDVLDELARRAGVDITVDDNVDTAVIVSLFYPVTPAVDVVLADLCTAQSLVFERTSRGFRIGRP